MLLPIKSDKFAMYVHMFCGNGEYIASERVYNAFQE